MKADAFVTNKVLFKQSNGAFFYVILSLFSLISSFCQEEENLTLSPFSWQDKIKVMLMDVSIHQASLIFFKTEVDIDIKRPQS